MSPPSPLPGFDPQGLHAPLFPPPCGRAKKVTRVCPCGAKSRGGGGAPPTTLILLRNQRKTPRARRRPPHPGPSASVVGVVGGARRRRAALGGVRRRSAASGGGARRRRSSSSLVVVVRGRGCPGGCRGGRGSPPPGRQGVRQNFAFAALRPPDSGERHHPGASGGGPPGGTPLGPGSGVRRPALPASPVLHALSRRSALVTRPDCPRAALDSARHGASVATTPSVSSRQGTRTPGEPCSSLLWPGAAALLPFTLRTCSSRSGVPPSRGGRPPGSRLH